MLESLWQFDWGLFSSWYEFAIHCYDFLTEQIPYEEQSNFLACYIFEGENPKLNNPNISTLNSSKDIMLKIIDDSGSVESGIAKLYELYNRIVLKPFEDDLYNHLAILFFLIKAVDEYYSKYPDKLYDIPQLLLQERRFSEQPFRTYVFSKNIENLFLDQIPNSEDYRLVSDDISGQFETLLFVEKGRLPQNCTPYIARVAPDKKNRPDVWLKSNKLKVGIIPFSMDLVTNFEPVSGAAIRVSYHEKYEEMHIKRYQVLLDAAIQAGCNIVIFPEYVVSPKIQEHISAYLDELYSSNHNNVNKLMVVIAGSGWEKGDSNVSRIFDYKGKLLGLYYKFSPYIGGDPQKIEALRERGKECAFVDLPGIGRILTPICRDVVNEHYTDLMVEKFQPFAVFIPAWSRSLVSGFKGPMETLARRYMTSSFLCNCCEALFYKELHASVKAQESNDVRKVKAKKLSRNRKLRGLAVFPDCSNQHNKSAKVYNLVRNLKICDICTKSSCVHLLSLDYSKVLQNDIVQDYTTISVKTL